MNRLRPHNWPRAEQRHRVSVSEGLLHTGGGWLEAQGVGPCPGRTYLSIKTARI